ncbi:MAG TPA: serine/threonine-protein kinase, partial [Vicinamibacterales bacterium]|nr:serine/threonine-protein kinase [Vicinamibacterales bacterium]
MADEQPSLSELIEAVADGTLDLASLAGKVPDGPLRELLAELQVLAGVAEVHRSQVAGETSTADVPTGATRVERWGNFELLRKVGEGSFGEVYLARDLWLDHQVALKVVKPHVLDSSLILKEARKLVRIRHPNVVTVHGADIQSGRVGFWMDFVDGPTLADVIRRDGVRSVDEAAAWAKDLCRALAVVHAAGIVHRDIKAQNVMRQRGDGRLILMDFGAGQFMDPQLGADGSTAGTPLYLAPELLDGARGTERSDIYALGVLLFYILSGRFPVEGSSWDELVTAHARGERRRLEDVRPDLPDAFAGLVRRMIAPDAADRFETVGAVRQALEGLQTPVPVHASSAAPTWTNAAVAAAGGIALITFSGYLCSMLYNSPIGRTGGFENESPLLWPVWGLRALIASGIVMSGLVFGFVIVRSAGRMAVASMR